MAFNATDTLLKLNNEAIEKSKKKMAAKELERLAKAIDKPSKLAREFADADRARIIKPNPVKKKDMEPSHHGYHFYNLSEEERMQCVHDYFLCGSLKDVAFQHNIIHKEIFDAASQPWWQMELNTLQRECTLRMKSKLTRIMNMTLDQLEDRVNNGDVQFDNEGESFRCPVSAQTLATVANVIFDKKLKLEDRASGFVEGENKRLIDLANSLTMMGAKAIDVIDVNVIDDVPADEGNENE